MAEPSRRSARTSGKIGMCVNKECKNYRQSVTVDHGEFVCPECGKSLVPLKGGANPQKKMWISALIGVVVIAAAVAVYLLSQGGSSEPEEVPVDTVAQVVEEPAVTPVDSVSAPVDTAVAVAEPKEEPKAESAETPKPQATGSALPYGKYTGPMSGGKPHGVGGSVAVNRSYTFDLNDGTTVDVASGDKIENTKYQNGRLVQGEIQRPNGDRKWITLGASNGR